MSYHVYTLPVDAVQPAKTFMDDLDTKLIAHAAWEFVETVTSGTRITNVYKCLGSVNSFGTDFFVGVCRTTLTSTVGFILGEQYNGTTKKFVKGAVTATSALAVAADGSYATDRHVADEHRGVAATAGFLGYCGGAGSAAAGMTIPTSGQTYYQSISNDCIIIGTALNTEMVYVGLYESFHAVGVDPFPVINLSAPSGAYTTVQTTVVGSGVFTRDLMKVSQTVAGAWTVDYLPVLLGLSSIKAKMGTSTPTVTPWTIKEQLSNKYWPSRVAINEGASANAWRGMLRNILFQQFDVAVTVGDTLTVDGVVYTVIGPFGYYTIAGANTTPQFGTLAVGSALLVSQAA